MISFRTETEIKPSPFRITHQGKILLIGSCFSENIGQKLRETAFMVRVNPFGVVYNPLSLLNSLGILLDAEEYSEDDLDFHNELWYSWDHHSSFSNPKKDVCLQKINEEIKLSSKHLKKSDFLVITFGTAWVYSLKKSGEIVSNCHKVPASEFDRRLLSQEDIVNSWKSFVPELLKKNKNLKIIFTVSPVRHLKDGAHGNQVSKSVLLLSIDQICDAFPGITSYFPSYEILLDDLRDYRFYAEDLVHPNSQATDYIWSLFEKVYFDKETIEISKEVKKLARARNHRVYNKNTQAYRKFIKEVSARVNDLEKKYPFLDLKEFK